MKLKRDKVTTIVKGKSIVGIYDAGTKGTRILLACPPEIADVIIMLWNKYGK